jgi:hypothetical protein
MLKKKYIKSRKVCQVVFELPAAEIPDDLDVENVHLVGSFNDWKINSTPMKRNKNKVYRVALDLDPGQTYQFRYWVNGEHWINEWYADDYVANNFGKDNCVVVTLTGNNGG